MKAINIFKFLGIIFLVTLIIFLASPWISLFLPSDLRSHTYAQISYQVIADAETAGLGSDEERIAALFDYVRKNIFVPPGSVPYEGRPLDYLINGIGWCDYMAKILDCLLAEENIPARYAMLMDKEDKLSIHTLNEIFIKNKWVIFDPAFGLIFKDSKGNYLTLDEASVNPDLIFNHPRLLAMKKLKGNSFDYYGNVFPVRHLPRRSQSGLSDLNIFDHLESFYVHLFRERFSHPFQDAYLRINAHNLGDDHRLFYLARNYHLFRRSELAQKNYLQLINNYQNSPYREDGFFFLGLLYINIVGDETQGIKTIQRLLSEYPATRWIEEARFYLGLAYERQGDTTQADTNYLKADIFKLDTATIERIAGYNPRAQ